MGTICKILGFRSKILLCRKYSCTKYRILSLISDSIDWFIGEQTFSPSSVIWLLLHPPPAPLPSVSSTSDTQEDWEKETTSWGEGLILYKPINTLCLIYTNFTRKPNPKSQRWRIYVSGGPTFGDFVTIRTEASMQAGLWNADPHSFHPDPDPAFYCRLNTITDPGL